MKILIVTPAPHGSHIGNSATAVRWGGFLRQLGNHVAVAGEYVGQQAELLIALHARKSAESIARFKQEHPERPLVLCLTGTDVYQDLSHSQEARASIELADRIVVLQPLAALEIPEGHRGKVVTVLQSAVPTKSPLRKSSKTFDVCVSGHLRQVKDPFRAAEAAKLLPAESHIRVLHLGGVLESGMKAAAMREEADNSRYRWLGDRPRWQAKRILARSRLLVVSSLLEGGANVISEAIVCGVPMLASEIPGNVGLLGETYPGYFAVGDTAHLASLMWRAEKDRSYLSSLEKHISMLSDRFSPKREAAAWRMLLEAINSQALQYLK